MKRLSTRPTALALAGGLRCHNQTRTAPAIPLNPASCRAAVADSLRLTAQPTVLA